MESYILAFDIGTDMGWTCRFDKTGKHISGEWDLSGNRFEGGGMRFLKFKSELKKILDLNGPPRFITYEEVRGHLGTDAAHIYGGFQAILTDYCEEEGIPYNAYPVGTVKKFATGKGNASKKKMVKAANEKWDKKFTVKNNENEVDARWVGELAFDKMGAT